jgi:hypothetical protein
MNIGPRKYLVVPGKIIAADGDIHYITGRDLIRLYGVDASQCVIGSREHLMGPKSGWIVLRPDPTGRYELPHEPNGIERALKEIKNG